MKHNILWAILFPIGISSYIKIKAETKPGDEISAPDWSKKIELIIAASAGLKESFDQSKAFYQEWRNNLATPPEELVLRVKQRKKLIKCIHTHFADKDTYINELNTAIQNLDKTIDELSSHIAFLELEIAEKNNHIKNLEEEIIKVNKSYQELIGEDEEKAKALMNTIAQLMQDYQKTVAERELFRNNLEQYYKILQEYNAEIRIDWDELEKSICKKNTKKSNTIKEKKE
ncbi:MAG: hypothetical protein WD055_04300 [Candidatus Dependentiae bacterium]